MSRDFLRSIPVGCAVGLCVASIDASAGFVAAGSRFRSLPFAVTGVAGVFLLTLVLFLLVRWLFAPFLFRGARVDATALSVAAATGTGAAAIAYHVGSFRNVVGGLFELTVVGLVGVVTALGAYALTRSAARSADNEAGAGFIGFAGRALPLALLAAVTAGWIGFVGIGDVTSVRFILVLIGLLVAVVVLARVVSALSYRTWVRVVLSASALLLLCGLAGTYALRTNRSPLGGNHARGTVKRVILLSVDTLRRDAVSCYGSTTVSTPNIDRIAADGCLFRNTITASSWTLPGFASIMTGLTTRQHGVALSTAVLPDTLDTLAECFRNAGYLTSAYVTNLILAPHRGFAQGFQEFHMPAMPIAPVSFCEEVAKRIRVEPLTVAGATRDLTDAAIAFTEKHRDQSYFLWVHYLDPHLPYTPPPEYVERMNVDDQLGLSLDIDSATRPSMDLFGDPARRAWARSLYDAEVRYVDTQIGRFLDRLQAAGLYDDTLLIFAVDHGEEFWDHDGFEHGHVLYNELVDVPLIIKLPGSHQSRVVDDYVCVADVTPTVLDMCGLPPVDTPNAMSLRGYLEGTSAPSTPDRLIYCGGTLFRSNFDSVIGDGWKYIRSATTGREELYNLREDPGERRSLVLDRPEVTGRYRKLLDDYERTVTQYRLARGIQNKELKLDEEEIARLRALGYL